MRYELIHQARKRKFYEESCLESSSTLRKSDFRTIGELISFVVEMYTVCMEVLSVFSTFIQSYMRQLIHLLPGFLLNLHVK